MGYELRRVVPHPMKQYTFGEDSVWDAESVKIEEGKHYMVKAHSGKGKSTLIAYLYGLRNDYDGSVSYNGKEMREISLTEKATIRQRHLSIALQDMRLFPKLTVKENLLLKNQLTDFTTWDKIQGMLERFGIGEKSEQLCGTLSLGQQQRVTLIRSLLQPFDFLLMDEPFSHLDIENQKIGCAMIREACEATKGNVIIASLGEHYYFEIDEFITV